MVVSAAQAEAGYCLDENYGSSIEKWISLINV
jgi:hypothetical protein